MLRPLIIAAILAPFSARAETPPALPEAPASEATAAVPCGGSFPGFLAGLRDEALAEGLPEAAIEGWLADARAEPEVLRADQRQGVFRKPFLEFAQSLIGDKRLPDALLAWDAHQPLFAKAESTYGIPPGVMLAIWGFETDFGRFQGNYNTRAAILTLAWDCRRPEMFRPQAFAAIQLFANGDLPLDTTGAWAGEIGMVQMLPKDILERGIDGDGDGHVRLKTSVPDALMSGANMLKHHGWRAGEPWLTEVVLPETFDWALSGLDKDLPVAQWAALGVAPRRGNTLPAELEASLLLPQGRKGPAFLVFPNFQVLLEWNKSLTYVTTAAYFATLIEGAEPALNISPDPLLPDEDMRALQEKLQALGYDVGKIDGVLGAGTRRAIQAEQQRLGLPADAWPTRELLDLL
ncbi:lytic murein transglycosylase [Pseudomonas sp. GX19020]|uniref:lytic murein transglycosylase n=1 Tax=Pseudomonas sp. GX19020 TaxID=2942277 RepID=UPI002018FC7E|nr:lytic murein transglycosylase [Pseudomonas sp. GX19020]MCL4066463.1 lytic murein transglycosylase [Pseudomonas sp. GX19020]